MDKYDKAIEHLNKHPDEIIEAWENPDNHKFAGCLFQFAGTEKRLAEDFSIGCLTQIKRDPVMYRASTEELTKEIISDDRIPLSPVDIQLTDLPVFAEWQRRLDKELGRE